MAHRLRKIGLAVERQRALQVRDEDGAILGDYFADLFVENCLILELKACKALMSEHVAQVLGYLRASGQRDAMLINFGSSRLEIKNSFCDFCAFCGEPAFLTRSQPILKKAEHHVCRQNDLPRCEFCKRLNRK